MKVLLFTLFVALFALVISAEAAASRRAVNIKNLKNLKNNNNLQNNNNNAAAAEAAAAASATLTAASATRTRPCDQGDISLQFGLTANANVAIGEQAATVTLQGLLGSGSASDISTAITRLQQFVSTSALQLQMCEGIADSDSFAQPQLALLAESQDIQQKLVGALTGSASDNSTLTQLLTSFQANADNSQDGADNALIDCFTPLTVLSG